MSGADLFTWGIVSALAAGSQVSDLILPSMPSVLPARLHDAAGLRNFPMAVSPPWPESAGPARTADPAGSSLFSPAPFLGRFVRIRSSRFMRCPSAALAGGGGHVDGHAPRSSPSTRVRTSYSVGALSAHPPGAPPVSRPASPSPPGSASAFASPTRCPGGPRRTPDSSTPPPSCLSPLVPMSATGSS